MYIPPGPFRKVARPGAGVIQAGGASSWKLAASRKVNKACCLQAEMHPWGANLLFRLRALAGLAIALLLTAACTTTPPVVKIGLVAPFEGLHRESGYAALHALRAAIADCGAGGAFIPLALDDSHQAAQARRAIEKIRLDPAAPILLGPLAPGLLPESGAFSQSDISTNGRTELAPLLVDERGRFATGDSWPQALAHYVMAVAAAAPERAAVERLLVVGLPAESAAQLSNQAASPADALHAAILLVPAVPPDRLEAILSLYQPGDGLLWLDVAPESPALLSALHEHHPQLPIILGPDAGHTVYAAHIGIDASLYWAVWSDAEYTRWASHHPEFASSDTYLVYRAACSALAIYSGMPDQTDSHWQLNLLTLNR
jgi:hypothetical protein